MKNKIGWCDMTWNPVWGCRNHCEYCYARGIAKRFYDVVAEKEYKYLKRRGTLIYQGELSNKLRHFVPTLLDSHLYRKLPKKPQRIFVGSMSEIAHWREEWIEMVIEKVKQYPQHIFQFLSKDPLAYLDYEFPQNCWLGLTIVRTPKYPEPGRWSFIEFKRNNLYNLKFVCFEPLLENIDLSYYLDLTAISWVIVGAETGNRRGKIIPNKEWLLYIIKYCDLHKIPIYIKDNLLKHYPKFGYMKEFPEAK
jgi:protein gp37